MEEDKRHDVDEEHTCQVQGALHMQPPLWPVESAGQVTFMGACASHL